VASPLNRLRPANTWKHENDQGEACGEGRGNAGPSRAGRTLATKIQRQPFAPSTQSFSSTIRIAGGHLCAPSRIRT